MNLSKLLKSISIGVANERIPKYGANDIEITKDMAKLFGCNHPSCTIIHFNQHNPLFLFKVSIVQRDSSSAQMGSAYGISTGAKGTPSALRAMWKAEGRALMKIEHMITFSAVSTPSKQCYILIHIELFFLSWYVRATQPVPMM